MSRHADRCSHHHITDAPTRSDPTGTGHIVRAFDRDLVRRFQGIRRLVWQAVAVNDVFGTGSDQDADAMIRSAAVALAVARITGDEAPQPGAFELTTSAGKVEAFMRWLRQEQARGVLEVVEGAPQSTAAATAWTNVYVRRAYERGVEHSAEQIRRAGGTVSRRWIDAAFNRPIHADRAGLAYTRTYDQLRGITEAMDQQISRTLAEALATGQGPRATARQLAERVDNLAIVRARVLARTETIAAHAEASLNAYEEAGIEGVDVMAEWSTAGDNAVCEFCATMADRGPYTLSAAHGLIPAHPNCRCVFIPRIRDAARINLQ